MSSAFALTKPRKTPGVYITEPAMHPTFANIRAGLVTGRLKPRYHAGVGFAQLYLSDNVRLHVWHPDLPTEPESFGCRHNHRFDFTSTVLVGAVTNIFLDVTQGGREIAGSGGEFVEGYGYFDEWEVQPAHLGAAVPTIKNRGVDLGIRAIELVPAGETYEFPKRVYHESRGHGTTVTVMRKFNQEDTWAGIVAPAGQPPQHGMANPICSDFLVGRFLDALEKVTTAGWDSVQAQVEEDTN